jgi:undecaprenyl-diphosphatase
MCGATGYTLGKMLLRGDGGFTAHQWGLLATGSVVSFLVAYASVAFFMGFIRKHSFQIFGYYRIALAILVVLVLHFLR